MKQISTFFLVALCFLSFACNDNMTNENEFILLQPEYRNDSVFFKWKYRNNRRIDDLIFIDLHWNKTNDFSRSWYGGGLYDHLSIDKENIISVAISAEGFPYIDTLYFRGQIYLDANGTVMTSNIAACHFNWENKSFYPEMLMNAYFSKADKKLYYFNPGIREGQERMFYVLDLDQLEIVSSKHIPDEVPRLSPSCTQYFCASNKKGGVEVYFIDLVGGALCIHDVNTLEKKVELATPHFSCGNKFISNNRGIIYDTKGVFHFDRSNQQFFRSDFGPSILGTHYIYYNETDNKLYATSWKGIVKYDLDEEGKIIGANVVKPIKNTNDEYPVYIDNSSWFIILEDGTYFAFNAETQEQIEITLPISIQFPSDSFSEYPPQLLYKSDNVIYVTNKTNSAIYCLSLPDFSVIKTIYTWTDYIQKLFVYDNYLYVIGTELIDKVKLK